MINRAKLRGAPLELFCKRAHTTTHEYGQDDDRVFCYGIVNCMNDELLSDCRNCKAHVDNAEPPKEANE